MPLPPWKADPAVDGLVAAPPEDCVAPWPFWAPSPSRPGLPPDPPSRLWLPSGPPPPPATTTMLPVPEPPWRTSDMPPPDGPPVDALPPPFQPTVDPPTLTYSVSPGVVGIVALTYPPLPGSPATPPARCPPAPQHSIWSWVTPPGTTRDPWLPM